MKKLIYTFLAVSIIFAACKKEDDTPVAVNGCTDNTALNYNLNATNDNGSCTYDLVGKWTATNVVIDSTLTVSYMGETIDSLSWSGSSTLTPQMVGTPTSLEFLSNGTVYAVEDGETETRDYSTNGNVLIVNGVGSFHYAINNSNLSLTGGEEDEDEWEIDLGNSTVMVDVYYLYTNTLNFTRNTSGIVNNNVNQKIGNTNHSWFVKPKFNNILKSIK
jgi:hypothetical protein